MKNIYNILLKRYKELYTYDCECRKVKRKMLYAQKQNIVSQVIQKYYLYYLI